MKPLLLFSTLIITLTTSCKDGKKSPDETKTESRTPVTITNATIGEIDDVIDLNATSTFLLKTYIKANANGYLQEVNTHLGENVVKGQKLFVIRSKEAEHLGNTMNKLDSSFRFKEQISIQSPGSGYITQLNYRPGDYVQDGESLAAISDMNSFAFLLELPYELTPFLPNNKTIELALPDGRKLTGTIASPMPVVDAASQTQNYIVRVQNPAPIPENLIATARFIKKSKAHAVSVPKDAVLTNEIQSEFWIMKMIDSTTAVKVPIVKGIETTNRVEILSPVLAPADKILLKGSYGLPDTAKVVIGKEE
jgi:multidrug efflux pump subunit AcrA (membrane-fusion protein)